jgi:16S rRNA (adenine1518-N6/adenine1519-N6)-dimethyltransferase
MQPPRAKKSYGQHFLTHTSTARRIAGSLGPEHPRVLEIGPGKGMLTQFLLGQSFAFKAIEADPDMVLYLEQQFPEMEGQVIQGNFLKADLGLIFDEQPFAIIGNFPYNISSQILFKTLDYTAFVPELVGMFQKEMAERVVADPGSKAYGVISVLVQAYYEGHYLFSVNRGQFDPPPKVQSGVIRLRRREDPLVPGELMRSFRRVVKQTFGQRRKMLRNTLKSFIPDADILKDERFSLRPERLTVEEFVDITRIVRKFER